MTKFNKIKKVNAKERAIVFIVKALVAFFFFVGVIHSCNVVIDSTGEVISYAEQTWENFCNEAREDPEFASCDVKYDYYKRVVVPYDGAPLLGLIQQQGFSHREACGLLKEVKKENRLDSDYSLKRGDVLCLPARER